MSESEQNSGTVYEWGDFFRSTQSDLYAPGWNSDDDVAPLTYERTGWRSVLGRISKVSLALLAASVIVGFIGISFVIDVFVFPGEAIEDPLATDSRTKGVMEELVSVLGREVLKEGHPAFEAAKWIVKDDDFRLSSTDSNFVQRSVLAYLFFSMKPNLPFIWLDKDIKECRWSGVSCNSLGMISALELDAWGLSGTLLPEISLLTDLEDLNFKDNDITGTVPKSWTSLENLENLQLEGNKIVGKMPMEFCARRFGSLTVDCDSITCACCTNCAADYKFDNEVEDEVEYDSVDSPDSSGTDYESITEDGYNNNSVDSRTQKGNKNDATSELLTELGVISPQIGNPGTPQAKAFEWISGQDLITAGDDIYQRYAVALLYYSLDGENWPFLSWLDSSKSVCHYPGISCDSPQQVSSITLVSSNLVGTIPNEIGLLSDLEVLDLSDNSISGEIPSSIAMMSKLKSVSLQHNNLSGAVDDSVCANSGISIQVDCSVKCVCCTCN